MKCRDTDSDFEGDADEKSFGKLGEDRLNIYIGTRFVFPFQVTGVSQV